MIRSLILSGSLLMLNLLTAQSNSNKPQPLNITIVPVTETGQRVETLIISDQNIQTALNALGIILQKHGYVYTDLIEALKILQRDLPSKQQGDLVYEAIRNAPVDMYIYVQLVLKDVPSPTPSQRNRQVQIQLYANDKYTAERHATSRWLYSTTRNWGTGYQSAIEEALKPNNGLDEFLIQIDCAFSKIIATGRVTSVEVIITDELNLDFNTELATDQECLGTLISQWIKSKSLGIVAQSGGNKVLSLQCRTPVRDAEKGIATPYDFAQNLAEYIRNQIVDIKGAEVEVLVINAKIQITIK